MNNKFKMSNILSSNNFSIWLPSPIKILTNYNYYLNRHYLQNLLVAVLFFSLILSVFFDPYKAYLQTLTLMAFSIIAILMLTNWSVDKTLRFATIILSIIFFVSCCLILYKPLYIDQYFITAILVMVAASTISGIKDTNIFNKFFTWLSFFSLAFYTWISFNISKLASGDEVLVSGYPFNRNTLSLLVLIFYTVILKSNVISNKIFKNIILIFSALSIINFGSRLALLSLILIWFFDDRYLSISRKMKNITISFLIAFGLTLPFAYVYYYQRSTPSTSVYILGKNIYTGRQDIWGNFLPKADSSYLYLGAENASALDELPANSLHNQYLELIYRKGLIMFIAFFLTIVLIASRPTYYFPGLMVLLLYCSLETVLISGTSAGMLLLLLLLPKHKLKDFSGTSLERGNNA